MPRIIWKKEQARVVMDEIARDVAEFFAIAKPLVFIPEGRTWREWEYTFETVEVWTKAGRAEINVRIDAGFAHMYFRFDDPARAVCFDDAMGRLNRHSGKWNAICTPDSWARHGKPDPQDSADMFRAELRRDFRKVAEKNPPADEVAAYRAKESARNAQWAEYMASGVILELTALGGKEIIPAVMIRDGLSQATIKAIQDDLRRSFELATLVNPAMARGN